MGALRTIFMGVAGLGAIAGAVLAVSFVFGYLSNRNNGSMLDEGIKPRAQDPHYQMPADGLGIAQGTVVPRSQKAGLIAKTYTDKIYATTVDNFVKARSQAIPLTQDARNHIIFTPQRNGATKATVDTIYAAVKGKTQLTAEMKATVIAALDASAEMNPTAKADLKHYLDRFGSAPTAQLDRIKAAQAHYAPILRDAIAAFEAVEIDIDTSVNRDVNQIISDVSHHFVGSRINLFLNKLTEIDETPNPTLARLIKEASPTGDFQGFSPDALATLKADEAALNQLMSLGGYMSSSEQNRLGMRLEAFMADPANERFLMTQARADEIAEAWGLNDPVTATMLGNRPVELAGKKTIIHALTEGVFVKMGFTSYMANRERLIGDINSQIEIQEGSLEVPGKGRIQYATVAPRREHLTFG